MQPIEKKTETQKLLSIIIPTYNVEEHVVECLDSLQKLKDESYEVIIVDGGSTDNTLNVILKYRHITDIVVSEKDHGIYDAMNKGISLANGDFIYFLGSDDIFVLQPYEVKKMLVESDSIYYGNVVMKEKNAKIYGGRFSDFKIIHRNICHQAIFYPRNVFDDYVFDIKYKLMADYAFNLTLWCNKKFKFVYVNKVIAQYSINGLSSKRIDHQFRKDAFKIIYKNFGIKGVLTKLFNPVRNLFHKRIYEY